MNCPKICRLDPLFVMIFKAGKNHRGELEMVANLIHDRGRGPEIIGTRITVYNLLPHFLDEEATESYICQLYDLTPEQVAAARAYVLNHAETVLAQHLRIEARMAEGNSDEFIARAKQTHSAFLSFKQWLVERQRAATERDTAEPGSANGANPSARSPTFREWLAEQKARGLKGS